MARPCTICDHPDRHKIDKALVAGRNSIELAEEYSLSDQALRRHRRSHISRKLQLAKSHKELKEARSLLDDVKAHRERAEMLYQSAETLLEKAAAEGDLRTALKGVQAAVGVLREARGYLELYGSITGELVKEESTSKTPTVVVILPQGELGELTAPHTPEKPYIEAEILDRD